MSDHKGWGDFEAFRDQCENKLNEFFEEEQENQHEFNEELHVKLNEEANEGTDKPKQKRKTKETKLEAAKMAREVSVYAAARFYKI